MLSPSPEIGTTTIPRRSRKTLKPLPTLARVISPAKVQNITQEPSLDINKEESEEEIKDSTSVILKPFPPVCKKEVVKKVTITEEQLEKVISMDDQEDRELIANILALRPRRRGKQEIELLQKALGEIKFFKEAQTQLDDISYERLFQALTLETFSAGDKIFNYGEQGKKFYILIQGSVYILIKSSGTHAQSNKEGETPQGASDEYIRQLREKLPDILTDNEQSEETKQKTVERCNPGFWAVKTMVSGESFGEVALSKELDGKRTATVVCKEKTALGILSYDDYHTILGNLYERKYRDNLEFIRGIDLFQHWRPNQLSSIIFNMEQVEFKRKQIIFKEGDIGEYIYFIKHGEVELTKQVERAENKELSAGIKKNKSILSPRTQLSKKTETVKLGIELERDYLGEAEILTEKPMEYTAKSYSTTVTLMMMNREKFVSLIKDEISLKCLSEHIRKKKAWRDDLIDKFHQRCLNFKANDLPQIEDSGHKSRSKQLFQEYFQSSQGSSPQNRPNRLYSTDVYNKPSSMEDLTLSTSPHHGERLMSSTKNGFANPISPTNKTNSANTMDAEPLSANKTGLTRYVNVNKSQKKFHGQVYVDHQKWLEETLKGSSVETPKENEAKFYETLNHRNSVNNSSARQMFGARGSKLEPLNHIKPTEEQQAANTKAKVWANYLHTGKNVFKKTEEKNKGVVKAKPAQLVNKKGLNLVTRINELMSKDLTKEAGKKKEDAKRGDKKRERLPYYLKIPAADKGVYFNVDGMYEGPSPLVRSLILSYRKIGESKKDFE